MMGFGTSCFSSDNSTSEQASIETPSTQGISKDYWIYRLVQAEKRQPFIQDIGWQNYYTRDFANVIALSKEESLARFHLEHAALYRQALLMHSYATQKTVLYKSLGSQNKETEAKIDPKTVPLDSPQHAYLIAIASIFLEDYPAAKTYFDRVPTGPEFDSHVAQWRKWLDSDKKSPPTLSGFFFSAEGSSINKSPSWNEDQYAFSMSDGSTYEATDGTSLWLLSRWHQDQAAKILAEKSNSAALIDQWLAPWRLPFETSFVSPTETKVLELTDDWFLFGFYLQAEDMAFMHAVSTDPKSAISSWKSKSTFAEYIDLCTKEDQLNAECIKDNAEKLRQIAEERNKELLKGIPIEQIDTNLLYVEFPSFVRFSLLRAAALYAFKTKQIDAAGYLMLEVREASGVVRDPVSLIFLTAYDAYNANTVRAPELLHEYADEFSALQSARIPLDFLQIQLTKDGSHIPTY